MELEFEWIETPGQYASGETCKIGPFAVGAYFLALSRRGDGNGKPWTARLDMPGLNFKPEVNRYATQADARAAVERGVTQWFKRAGLIE